MTKRKILRPGNHGAGAALGMEVANRARSTGSDHLTKGTFGHTWSDEGAGSTGSDHLAKGGGPSEPWPRRMTALGHGEGPARRNAQAGPMPRPIPPPGGPDAAAYPSPRSAPSEAITSRYQ